MTPGMTVTRSRDFHRLGLIFALIVGIVGLAFIAHDAVTLRLWEVRYDQLPALALGSLIGLVEIAVVCLAAYGFVRAIGWVVSRSGPIG